MNKEARGLLIGMAIGDGHIALLRDKRWPNAKPQARLAIKHSAKQREYVEHKSLLIGKAFRCKAPKVTSIDNNGYPGVQIVKSHPYLRTVRRWLYSGGRKKASNVIRFLTLQGLALWYMDDGSLSYKKRDGRIHARELHLNTYTDRDEAELTSKLLLERFGVALRPSKHTTQISKKEWWRLRCGSKEANNILALIDPFVIPSMKYKTDMKYLNKVVYDYTRCRHERPASEHRPTG